MTKANSFQCIENSNPIIVFQLPQAGIDPLPPVPALPETLLQFDVLALEPAVDLRAMSQVVLDDLGATLQIFRLAGRQYGNTPRMPRRIEDCISDLGVSACRNAVAQQTPIRHSRQGHITKMWAHAREIAKHAKQVAHEMPRVNPEEAYLVGLLHLLASLPVVLGWEISGDVDANDALNGWQLAKRWSLPRSLFEYFSEMIIPGCETHWLRIVRTAHQRASRSGVNCPFELDLRPGPVAGK